MKIISGRISCTKRNTIPSGSTVYVQAIECFVDKNPIVLGSIVIQSASTFPVLFEMSFDEKPIIEKRYRGMYLIIVNIQKKDKIQFNNDGKPFVIEKIQHILDKIDIEVDQV